MSTASDTERMPDMRSLLCIQSGLGRLGSTPVTVTATNRGQASVSERTGKPSVRGVGVTSDTGSVNGTPNACAVSRARPRTDRQ